MKKGCNDKRCRPPDLEAYITDQKRHYYVTYGVGARAYSLNYWTFVRLAKEAGATWALRKTAVVDLKILDAYMDEYMREDYEVKKGVRMAKRNEIEELNSMVKKGKKYMRSEEAREYFSIGRHTMENWAKQAHAIYKINGVKLINIEKIERFIEAFEEVD